MTSYSEEYEKAREVRTNAILSFKSIRELKTATEVRKEDLHPIVFGSGSNPGILTIIASYMEQTRLADGRKTSTPDFSGDWATQYKNNLALCVKGSGDGTDGIYPPELDEGQPTEKAQKEVNPNSKWFQSFSLEGAGVNPTRAVPHSCDDLVSAIGTVALRNQDRRGPYSSQTEAEAQRDLDRGSGFLALRTENSEIFSETVDPPADAPAEGEDPPTPIINWYIGQDGIDTPDNYTFLSILLSKINSIISGINAYKGSLETSLDLITNPGELIEEFQIELPTDTDRLEGNIQQSDTYVSQLNDYKEFFSSTEPTEENRALINQTLQELSSFVSSSIKPTYLTYATQSSVQLGTADSGLRKGLIYWVTELVKKPDGPYSTLEGIPQLFSDAQTGLQKADTSLNSFSSDKNSWLSTPSVLGVFDQAVLNLDKTVKRWETYVLWGLVSVATKYRLFYKEIEDLRNLSNDPWEDAEYVDIKDLNENGFLNTSKIFEPPTKSTFFRVKAYEDNSNPTLPRVDTFDSTSKQSDIISGSIPFVQIENEQGKTVLQFSEEVFKSNSIRETMFFSLNNGTLAQVESISDFNTMLDGYYGTVNSVNILYGYYHVESVVPVLKGALLTENLLQMKTETGNKVLLSESSPSSAEGIKISELEQAQSLLNESMFVVVQNGTTYKVPFSVLKGMIDLSFHIDENGHLIMSTQE